MRITTAPLKGIFVVFSVVLVFDRTICLGQLPSVSDAYKQTAELYRKAAQTTLCPDRKAMLLKIADYEDCRYRYYSGGYNTGKELDCTFPPGSMPPCPADGAGSGSAGISAPSPGKTSSSPLTAAGYSTNPDVNKMLQAIGQQDPEKAKLIEQAGQTAQQIGLAAGLDLEASQFGGDVVRTIGGLTTLFGGKRKKEKELKETVESAQKEQASLSPPKREEALPREEASEKTVQKVNPVASPSAALPVENMATRGIATREADEDLLAQMRKRVLDEENMLSRQQAGGTTGTHIGRTTENLVGLNASEQDQFTIPTTSGPAAQEVLLIRSYPNQTIPAVISYQSDEVINYRTREGASASISKNELVTIVYPDGSHSDYRPGGEVSAFLKGADQFVQKWRSEHRNVVGGHDSTGATTVSNRPTLSNEQYQQYRQKALDQVVEFVEYLNVITDKSRSSSDRTKAVNQAAILFSPDATIAVTSKARPGIRRYAITAYLNNLKLLPYRSANIEWNEVNYVKELAQEADGNYYGIISGQQTFTGIGSDGKVIYSDVTEKNVKVKLQSYEKLIDGQNKVNWNVLLGNIGISVVE